MRDDGEACARIQESRRSRATLRAAIAILSAACISTGASGFVAATVGGWQGPGQIGTDTTGDAAEPRVSADGDGRVVAVWSATDGIHRNIWANRFSNEQGWGNPLRIQTISVENGSSPDVATDARGNAAVVWRQFDGVRFNVWANRYAVGAGWGYATLLEHDDVGDASMPRVGLDASGNGLAVWQQSNGTFFRIWSSQYLTGSGWQSPLQIDGVAPGNAMFPRLVVNSAGDGMVVWQLSEGGRVNVMANHFNRSSGWEAAATIETYDGGDATAPAVSIDAADNATAIWQQMNGSDSSVWVSTKTSDDPWTSPTQISPVGGGNGTEPFVGTSQRGDAVAVWSQENGSSTGLWASRSRPTGGWEPPFSLSVGGQGFANRGRVMVSEAGEATVAWQQFDGAFTNIWATRYTISGRWGAPVLLETDDAGNAFAPEISCDPWGNAFAVWYQDDGIRFSIRTSLYLDETPPALILEAPLDGTVSSTPVVWVAGSTEPGVRLSANGAAASVAANGSFGLYVALVPGPIMIKVTAVDGGGNQATVYANVSYADPLAALQATLQLARADLDAALAKLAALEMGQNSSEASLREAVMAIEAAEARLAQLEAALGVTRSTLTAAEANLTAHQSEIETTHTRLGQTNESLAEARLDLTATRAALQAAQQDAAGATARASTAIGLAIAAILLSAICAAMLVAAILRRRDPATRRDEDP